MFLLHALLCRQSSVETVTDCHMAALSVLLAAAVLHLETCSLGDTCAPGDLAVNSLWVLG
jgi:hypothetical protein